jgi:bifunctional enzyme CysN/CysC/sulfate adenylyltransferase subunit 1
VLVDARNGLVRQSRRHAAISALLRTPHLVVAVNKMDLVDYDQASFDRIVADFRSWSDGIAGFEDVSFIPVSALKGDNVVDLSERMPWYDGPALLDHLETVEIAGDRNFDDWRFPVQWVVRPRDDEHHDYRGYAGQVAGGVLVPGEEVVVLPSGRTSRIASIESFEGSLAEAFPPQSVTVRLEDDVDVSRGDLIARPSDAPTVARELEAVVCWMADAPLRPRARYAIKHAARAVRAVVDGIDWKLDVETLGRDPDAPELALNEIGHVKLRLSAPLAFDPYERNRDTGSFILIDEASNDTVGAGLIV